MYLLPYYSFKIETSQTPESAFSSLESKVDHKKIQKITWSTNAEFHGEVSTTEFKIMKSIRGRNAYLPLITGNFIPSELGTIIYIEMGLAPFTVIIMCIWLGITGMMAIIGLFDFFQDSTVGYGPFLHSTYFFLAGIIFTLGSFWFEAIKQKSRLIEIFDGVES
ncbi:MAG: hypothetical protein AAF902_18660 [Chloroflexota bacterium]